MTADPIQIRAFHAQDAASILTWVTSLEELRDWAGAGEADFPPGLDRFATWHTAEGVDPYVLDLRGTAAGYGEIWEDREQGEVELARLLVAPSLRGRGLGRALVGRLAEVAVTRGYAEVWLRVGRPNLPALACYTRAGFERATAEEEDRFNRGQPRAYAWMRWTERG